jgi:hypothetical protein
MSAPDAPRPAVEVRDGAVVIDLEQLDAKNVRLIKSIARKFDISFEDALHKMLTEGAKVMMEGRPQDGQHRKHV